METTGTNLTFEAQESGAYRIEAWLSADGADRPLLIGDGPALPAEELPMTAVRDLVLGALALAGESCSEIGERDTIP